MSKELAVNLFDQPSGNVRGVVNAFLVIGRKRRRIAHATLLVGKAPDVVVEVEIPNKVHLEDIGRITELLTEFQAAVAKS